MLSNIFKGKFFRLESELLKTYFPNTPEPTFTNLPVTSMSLRRELSKAYSHAILPYADKNYILWLRSVPDIDRIFHERIRAGVPCHIFLDVEWDSTSEEDANVFSTLAKITTAVENEIRRVKEIPYSNDPNTDELSTMWGVWNASRPRGEGKFHNSYHLIEQYYFLDDYVSMYNLATRLRTVKGLTEVDFKIYHASYSALRLPNNHKKAEGLISVLSYDDELSANLSGGRTPSEEGRALTHGVYVDKSELTKYFSDRLTRFSPLKSDKLKVRKAKDQIHPDEEFNMDYMAYVRKAKAEAGCNVDEVPYKTEFEDSSIHHMPTVDSLILSKLKHFKFSDNNRPYWEMTTENERIAVSALNRVRAVTPNGWVVKYLECTHGEDDTYVTYKEVPANYWDLNNALITRMKLTGKNKDIETLFTTKISEYVSAHTHLVNNYTSGTIFAPWSFTCLPHKFDGWKVRNSPISGTHTFNLFRGFELDKVPVVDDWEDEMMETVTPFIDFVRDVICWSPDEKERPMQFISFLSRVQDILRYPGTRFNAVTLIQGMPGIGKTGVVNVISKLVGWQYASDFGSLADLEEHFNSAMAGKLIISINEATKDDQRKGRCFDSDMTGLSSVVKSLITENRKLITKKHKESEMADLWFALFLTSDRFGRFWVDAQDRRIDFFQCKPWNDDPDVASNEKRNTQEMFKKIFDYQSAYSKRFFHYLFLYIKYYFVKPEGFEYKDAGVSSAKANAIRGSYTPEVYHFVKVLNTMYRSATERWKDSVDYNVNKPTDHPKNKEYVLFDIEQLYKEYTKSGLSDYAKGFYTQRMYSKSLQEKIRLTTSFREGSEYLEVPRNWSKFKKAFFLD